MWFLAIFRDQLGKDWSFSIEHICLPAVPQTRSWEMNFLPASHRSLVSVHYCCSSVSMMLEKTARIDFNSKSFAGEPQFRRGTGYMHHWKKGKRSTTPARWWPKSKPRFADRGHSSSRRHCAEAMANSFTSLQSASGFGIWIIWRFGSTERKAATICECFFNFSSRVKLQLFGIHFVQAGIFQ